MPDHRQAGGRLDRDRLADCRAERGQIHPLVWTQGTAVTHRHTDLAAAQALRFELPSGGPGQFGLRD